MATRTLESRAVVALWSKYVAGIESPILSRYSGTDFAG
jgi:hypothetical protein